MRTPFDPTVITAETGLSRIVIGDNNDSELAGLRAEDACSRDALLGLAVHCGLVDIRPHRVADDIAAATRSAHPAQRHAADRFVNLFARRLSALITTLRDPATVEWQGDVPARRAYLEHWLSVDQIRLAGGLLTGIGEMVAGTVIKSGARAARPCSVELAPFPAVTAQIGAARLACAGAPGATIAVADLGQTSIKTALATHGDTGLQSLHGIGAQPAPVDRSPEAIEQRVTDALVNVVRRALENTARAPVHLVVSIAAHVSGGAPVNDGAGVYGCLSGRIASLRRQVAERSGAILTVEFVHDATSAAAAGPTNSATVVLGTWPGSGFRPGDALPLPPIAPDFAIHHG